MIIDFLELKIFKNYINFFIQHLQASPILEKLLHLFFYLVIQKDKSNHLSKYLYRKNSSQSVASQYAT